MANASFSHFCVVLLHSIECYYTVQKQLISTQWFLKNSAIRRKLIISAVSVRQRSSSRWTPCDLTPFLLTKNQNLSVWLTPGQFINLPQATWCRPWKTTKKKKTAKREVGIVVNLFRLGAWSAQDFAAGKLKGKWLDESCYKCPLFALTSQVIRSNKLNQIFITWM